MTAIMMLLSAFLMALFVFFINTLYSDYDKSDSDDSKKKFGNPPRLPR